MLLAHDGGVTLLFGGDIIPHTPIKTAAKKHGWESMFAPLTSAFADADFVIVNMEAPVVQLKKPEDEEKVFWAPPELPRALARAGVDVAGFANNHCLDQHREGIASTRALMSRHRSGPRRGVPDPVIAAVASSLIRSSARRSRCWAGRARGSPLPRLLQYPR